MAKCWAWPFWVLLTQAGKNPFGQVNWSETWTFPGRRLRSRVKGQLAHSFYFAFLSQTVNVRDTHTHIIYIYLKNKYILYILYFEFKHLCQYFHDICTVHFKYKICTLCMLVSIEPFWAGFWNKHTHQQYVFVFSGQWLNIWSSAISDLCSLQESKKSGDITKTTCTLVFCRIWMPRRCAAHCEHTEFCSAKWR